MLQEGNCALKISRNSALTNQHNSVKRCG